MSVFDQKVIRDIAEQKKMRPKLADAKIRRLLSLGLKPEQAAQLAATPRKD